MPVIDVTSTAKGCCGNRIVPAITSGVLGSRVKPRRIENTRYMTQIRLPKRSRKAAIFSAENERGKRIYEPTPVSTTSIQTTRMTRRRTSVVFDSFDRNANEKQNGRESGSHGHFESTKTNLDHCFSMIAFRLARPSAKSFPTSLSMSSTSSITFIGRGIELEKPHFTLV